MVGKLQGDDVQGDACCFAADTGNEDGACAVFTCGSGLLISYSQNFVVKRSAARRGCRIIGTRGSAEFDFYTGQIRVDDYFTPQAATHQITSAGNHFGGDKRLALAFPPVLAGDPAPAGPETGPATAACPPAARRPAVPADWA